MPIQKARWPSSQKRLNQQTKKPDGTKMRLDSKAGMLNTCQSYCIVASLVFITITVMILSSFAPDMLIYDEGNVYSCPADHINNELSGKVQ